MEPQDPDHRTRHVAFRLEAEGDVSRGDVVEAVHAAARDRLGQAGLEAMHPWLTVFEGDQGLLRVRHTHQDEARDVLEAIDRVGDAEARVETLGTGGTIRAAREEFLDG